MTEPRVVASGAIRVDARRAVAKLREHLLVDLHAYALELARATVAANGRSVHVTYDSDDVVFALDAVGISKARLPQLLSYVLSDNDELRDQPIRLLALGVNAALGLDPSFVDVFRCDGSDVAKVRWTPRLLARDDAALPELEAASRPAHAPKNGVVVHVRRKLGKAVLVNAVTGRVPPEIQLLSAHTHETEIELRLGGKSLRREGRARALLRVPFRLPNAKRADVEILPSGSTPSIELHECGVRLTELAWQPISGLPATSADGSLQLPMRVVVDARMLETNASRSALREDSDMMRALVPAATEAARKALDALVRVVTGDRKPPSGVELLDADPLRLEDALGAIVCVVANAPATSLALREHAAILELPLLYLADGTRTSVAALRGERFLHVLRVKRPLPPRLRPWFSHVVALSGRAVERALTGVSLVDAAGLIDVARQSAERREAHLSRPESKPALPPIHNELARETFRFREGRWAGLEGEVALVVPRLPEEQRAQFRFHVEDRLLEALPLEPTWVPLAFEAALSWPGHVRPRFAYDAVERDGGMVQAINAVNQIAIGLANKVAVHMEKLSAEERTALQPILTRAILSFGAVPERMGLARPSGFSQRFRALYATKSFLLTTGERVSLAELARHVHDTQALCAVRAVHSAWSTPDGRPVVVARADDARLIAAALGAQVRVVPYERALEGMRATDEARHHRLLDALQRARVAQGLPASGPVWSFRIGAALGAMTPSHSAVRVELHAGVRLYERPPTRSAVPVITAVDDPELVPTPEWDGAITATRDTQSEEMLLAQRLVSALGGDPRARAELGVGWETSDPAISVFLLEFTRHFRAVKTRGAAEQVQAIEGAPILEMLDERGVPRRVSIAEVVQTHGSKVPLLEKPPGFATLDWKPVLAGSGPLQVALQRRFAQAYVGTFLDIMEHEKLGQVEVARRELLDGSPELDPTDLGDLAEHGARRVEVSDLVTGISVVAALPRPGPTSIEGRTRVLYLRRKIAAGVDAPFAAVVNLSRAEDLTGFRFLSTDGAARIRAALVDAGSRLLESVLDVASTPGNAGVFFGDSRALELYGWLAAEQAALPLEAKMFDKLLWPTVQGEERASEEFWRLNETWYGTERHPDWVRREGMTTDLDRPVAWLPPGPHQSSLLGAFMRRTLKMRDVTRELANLQKERGKPQAPPILTGMPLHPALRSSLSRLGVTVGVGELELVPGPGSELYLQLLGAQSSLSAASFSIPVRVVIRIESPDAASAMNAALSALEAAIEKMVLELLPLLDTLPSFVRENARKVTLSRLGRGDSPLLRAPLFLDTTGTSVSLTEVVAKTHEPWAFTTLAPPFPKVKRRCLLMTPEEAKLVKPHAELRFADPAIVRAREVLARRTAPQLASVGLTDAERAQCVVTTTIATENVTGEVGVLAPHAAASRGIRVHVTRRSLCRLDDTPGLPLIGAINDDTIKPDRAFTKIAHMKRAARVAAEVRQHANRALEAAFSPPSDCLGSEWIDGRSCGGLRVTGRLWIPSDPSRIAPVSILSSLSGRSVSQPLQVQPTRGVRPEVPIEGRLLAIVEGGLPPGSLDPTGMAIDRALSALTEHSALRAGVGELGLRVAEQIVAALRLRGPVTPVLDEYAFHLALLGAKLPAPELATTEGKSMAPADVLVELRRRGVVWTSDGAGFVDGEFPSAPPAFILRAAESPAMRALEARLVPGAIRRVGSSPSIERHAELVVNREVASEEVSTPSGETPANFWKSLGRRVSSLFEEPPADDAKVEVLDALLERVTSLQLAGEPVQIAVSATKGRPLRYDRRKRSLIVCTRHPIVVRLARDEAGMALLAAAAACEINRGLVDVTDSDERRALVTLLP